MVRPPDPVVIDIVVAEDVVDGEAAWRLDTQVQVLVGEQFEVRSWSFWVGLGPDDLPAVLQRAETGER